METAHLSGDRYIFFQRHGHLWETIENLSKMNSELCEDSLWLYKVSLQVFYLCLSYHRCTKNQSHSSTVNSRYYDIWDINHLHVVVYDKRLLLAHCNQLLFNLQSNLYVYPILRCLYSLACRCAQDPCFDGLAKDVGCWWWQSGIRVGSRSVDYCEHFVFRKMNRKMKMRTSSRILVRMTSMSLQGMPRILSTSDWWRVNYSVLLLAPPSWSTSSPCTVATKPQSWGGKMNNTRTRDGWW